MSDNVCNGNGGGGAIIYQVFATAAIVQWEQVRNYVDPPGGDPAYSPGCDDDANFWTPLCPASQDPTSSTFQAVMFMDGGVMYSYKDMPVPDPLHPNYSERGTGLSWSPVSIGYEDRAGVNGDQIIYDIMPASGTTYYIPPVCTDQSLVPPTVPTVDFDTATCPETCVKPGKDYGGRLTLDSGLVCNFAPILVIYTDNLAWATNHTPGWYGGDVIVDAAMDSAYACQRRCAETAGCTGFAYEYENSTSYNLDHSGAEIDSSAQTYFHECYVKSAFANAHSSSTADYNGGQYADCSGDACALDDAAYEACNEYPYVVWSQADYATGEGDLNWHCASGPTSCNDNPYDASYSFTDISRTGTAIGDLEWTNPFNSWSDDDGWFAVDMPFAVPWFGVDESSLKIGTNGLITFGSNHLRNGASEPMPCLGFCGRNTGSYGSNGYGSHGSNYDWGVDGVIAPLWSDINPCGGTDGPANVCLGNGGGGQVIYKLFADAPLPSLVVQWEAVRNYVDPDPSSNLYQGCADSSNFWTPACPASQDPTTMTFQAVVFGDGGFAFNYKTIPSEDYTHNSHQARGTGLSWSPASIGYESQAGDKGGQLMYDELPSEASSFYVPPACSDENIPGPIYTLADIYGR
eukprot:SAG22_NODE_658_length_8076_cov_4.575279_5_plen_631_part_00